MKTMKFAFVALFLAVASSAASIPPIDERSVNALQEEVVDEGYDGVLFDSASSPAFSVDGDGLLESFNDEDQQEQQEQQEKDEKPIMRTLSSSYAIKGDFDSPGKVHDDIDRLYNEIGLYPRCSLDRKPVRGVSCQALQQRPAAKYSGPNPVAYHHRSLIGRPIFPRLATAPRQAVPRFV
jgi:hypothetical protein